MPPVPATDLMTELSVLNAFFGIQRETSIRPVVTGFQPPFLFQPIIPNFRIGFN